MPAPIRIEIFDAARTVLKRNGLDPDHPAFATEEIQRAAVDLLYRKSGWEREACAAVVAGLVD
jgi:hypothetical protein